MPIINSVATCKTRYFLAKMFRSAVLLFVVLFGVSAVYGIPPKQLEFTQSYQERLHKFAVLEQCQKHVIATDTEFTNFQSIESKTDNSTFRFYSIPENKIRFALTAVLDGVQNNFYAAEFLTFDITHNVTIVKNATTFYQKLDTAPVLLQNQPNEIAIHLNDEGVVFYFINGYKYSFAFGEQAGRKSFRYVSFTATATNNFDSQDFFFECPVHSPVTSNMENITYSHWTGY